jgi:hypothetical protein
LSAFNVSQVAAQMLWGYLTDVSFAPPLLEIR